jgi:glycosyltransferase involved in cell wall biosynthesis
MRVSCITITQAGRLPLLQTALQDFARQSYQERELIILHDAGATYHEAICAHVQKYTDSMPHAMVQVHAVAPGTSLGALRNKALDWASGALICQWDDDDRHHPLRLELQVQALRVQAVDFCFLSDQLHLFYDDRMLTWDDWSQEPYPLNFVQGTLLGFKDKMPRYPNLARGEDTGLCLSILEAGCKIARLRDVGWSYVYTFHGANAWHRQHHAAIAKAKHRSSARVLASESLLRRRLAEYVPALGPLTMPLQDGVIQFG